MDKLLEQEGRFIAQINEMGVYDVLRHVRFDKSGSPWVMGAVGDALLKRAAALRNTDQNAWVSASKTLGWD